MIFALFFLVSVISGLGTAIVLVEKRYTWPVMGINVFLRRRLNQGHPKLGKMLTCVTCTAVWACLLADLLLFLIALCHGSFYFFWPFSGLAAGGIGYLVFTLFEVLEKAKE